MRDPRDEFLWLDKRLPSFGIPHELIALLFLNTGKSTDKKYSFVSLLIVDFNITKHKNISISAHHALDSNIPKLSLRVRSNLIMFTFDKMVNNMRGNAVLAPVITKPFHTAFIGALYHTAGVRKSTKRACMSWPLFRNWRSRRFLGLIIRIRAIVIIIVLLQHYATCLEDAANK